MPERVLIDDAKIRLSKLAVTKTGHVSAHVDVGGVLRPKKGAYDFARRFMTDVL